VSIQQINTFLEGQCGPTFVADGNTALRERRDKTNASVFAAAHAAHHEAASRNKVFMACNQAVVTFGTALTATGVTFHLCNPIGSSVDLVVLQTTVTILTAGTGGHLVYAWNPPSSTAVTAGTALAVVNRLGSSGVGQAKSATTLPVAAPTAIRTLAGAITAAGINNITDYVDGAIIVAPGAQLSIQGITIVGTGLIGMCWEEVPLAA
jgi:hypothetical protein